MKDRNALAAALASLVGDEELERAARASGFVVRKRKVRVAPLFWTLVLGMQTMRLSSLSGLQRLYQELTDMVLASASFPGAVQWTDGRLDAHGVRDGGSPPG